MDNSFYISGDDLYISSNSIGNEKIGTITINQPTLRDIVEESLTGIGDDDKDGWHIVLDDEAVMSITEFEDVRKALLTLHLTIERGSIDDVRGAIYRLRKELNAILKLSFGEDYADEYPITKEG